jgi:hypothetical protein
MIVAVFSADDCHQRGHHIHMMQWIMNYGGLESGWPIDDDRQAHAAFVKARLCVTQIAVRGGSALCRFAARSAAGTASEAK